MNNETQTNTLKVVDAVAEKTKDLIEDKSELAQKKLKEAVDLAQVGVKKHWKTAAVILGVGLLTRLFFKKR